MGTTANIVKNWRNWKIWGVPLIGLGAASLFGLGILFWGGFNTAMEATNTLGFCVSCHEMESTVFQEYKATIHYQNRTGVRAICSDCHVPKSWVHKFVRKIKATRELYHKAMGSINTKEKFEAKRLTLAKNVWSTMKETDSRECRNCHTIASMSPEFQRPRARKQHLAAMEVGQTCIDCHKGIAHKDVRNLLSEEELEDLEKPNPAFAFSPIPQPFLDSLKRVEENEKAEERKKLEEYAAAEADVEERIKSEVEKQVSAQLAQQSSQSQQNSTDTSSAQAPVSGDPSGIDWSGVVAKNITLFYPGQASFEWVQTGKDHGGARAFLKGGDRCSTCHLKEVKDMGAKIVSGEILEPTPIEGKRGSIDVKLQATHDEKNLYLRFRWKEGKHAPVTFVDGGKMDAKNQVKLAVMLAQNSGKSDDENSPSVELVTQAGCWVTCHHDSRFMPHKPDAEAMTKFAAAADRLELEEGITKYIKSSRTKIEVKGRRGKIRGGWEKLKDEAELATLLENGSYLDLYRFNSGDKSENGHVAASRSMGDKGGFSAVGSLEASTWTVVMSRPLRAEQPGDITIQPGKLYTVGFAIHDDYADARFHHVSLEYYLGLDNEEADINVAQ